MPATWIYVLGGIIIAIIALVIASNLISRFIEISLQQRVSSEFSNLHTDIESVCLQERRNEISKKISLPSKVRVIYAANDIEKILPKIIDQIKNQEISSGENICLQFNDEDKLRCEKISCTLKMPYIGNLPESEDIWTSVNKILGRPQIKDYNLFIKKTTYKTVNITVE
jgi:hypothetical protein